MSVIIEKNATVLVSATIEGSVTIDSYTVVHPHAVIKAGDGKIVIGKNNIIEEGVIIENKGAPGSVMVIGDDNHFKVKSRIFANKIGNNNLIGVYAEVGEGTEITNMCTICPYGAYLIQYEPMKERTVIYNGNMDQRRSTETPTVSFALPFFIQILLCFSLFKYTVKSFERIF